MKLIRTYKPCRYCKKPGKFNALLGKVLCDDHADIYLNIRSVWEAISEIQLNMPRERN